MGQLAARFFLYLQIVTAIALTLPAAASPGTKRATAETHVPVKISKFLSGVPVAKDKKLKVHDFKLGKASVKNLFIAPLDDFGRSKVVIKIRDKHALTELRTASLYHDNPRLEVVFEVGSQNAFKRALRRYASGLASPVTYESLGIPFVIESETTCDQVTRVIYRSIDMSLENKIREIRLEGDSSTPIRLDTLFSLLLDNKVEPFIRKLDPPEKDPCFGEFHLLKWLRNESVDRFGDSHYSLHPGLKDALRGIGGFLTGLKWERYRFQIELIGYADPRLFDKRSRSFDPKETGIDDWTDIEDPSAIYYKGCDRDQLQGPRPVSVAFGERSGTAVGSEVNNNCELGATRAYVASAFLMSMLGTSNIEYKYGTGGILQTKESLEDSSKKAPLNDPSKRKVEIQILVKSAERVPRVRRSPDPGLE